MNALSSSLESESLRRATGQPKDGKDEEMTEEDEDYDEEEDEHSCRNDSSRAKRHANRGSIVPLSTVPDIYGQVHPQETDSLVQQSLHEFDAAVDRLADSAKRATLSAQKKCPELLTPSFKLLFLRCEVFHIKRAAMRYVKYWEQRLETFGPDKAFTPLTLTSALRDDTIPLYLSSMQIIRRQSPSRDILYFDPSKLDKTLYTRDSACRALWYWFHAMLEDEQVQKRGIIILNYNANFSLRNRDPTLTKLCLRTVQGILPIRMSAIHGCHAPLMYSCLISFILVFVGERVRQRILAHNGSQESVLCTLRTTYGIQLEDIPTDMGGNRVLDVAAWLNERKRDGL